jgi:quercetin dioxygenase-like cupin family protein
LMEEGEITLRAGDTVVQRGTPHGWANDSDQDCIVAGILINAEPLPSAPGS